MRELEAIARLTARAADPGDPIHAILLADLAETSGLHPTSLTRLAALWAAGWQHRHLQRALRRGLAGRASIQQPVGHVAIVAPGNLCVATWQPIVEALLVGNRVSVRPGSGDPRAVENFRAALHEVDPTLAARLESRTFARADRDAWRSWLATADALLVYGGDAAIAAILGLAAEAGYAGRLRLHGHFQSLGVVCVDALRSGALDRLARAWAQDTLLADGRGCMSQRALWLLGAPTPADRMRLRAALQRAFAQVAAELPAGVLAPAWQADAQLAVTAHAFAAATEPGCWLEQGVDWAILGHGGGAEPPHALAEPAALPESVLVRQSPALGPGSRVLRVLEASDGADLARQLAPWRKRLSTVSLALESDPGQVLAALAALGVHRTCAPGQMQAPLADRAPDGHPLFTALLRETDRA